MSKRTPIDGTSNSDAERRTKRLVGPELEVPEPGGFDPALLPGPDDITVVTASDLSAAASPRGGQTADPPATPDTSPAVPESSPTAGSGGGSGRPSPDDDQLPTHRIEPATGIEGVQGPRPILCDRCQATDHTTAWHDTYIKPPGLERPIPHRSIGRPIANTAFDAAKGVPVEVQDEQAHAREATEILLEAAADHYRHDQLMPYPRLLDLHAVVEHMVEARRVVR